MPELADSTIISIATIDDKIVEEDSVVSVTLLPSAGFSIDETAKSAQITVFDNEPTISVRAESPNIAWGEDVRFIFAIEDDVTDVALVARELLVEITQSGDSLMGPLPTKVMLPAGATSTTLSISSPHNTINISDYQIIALIKSHHQYRVSSSSNRASVTMVEHPPIVSLVSPTGDTELVEGESIDLQVSLTKPFDEDTEITVNLSDTHGFLAGPTIRTVSIPAGVKEVDFSITTVADSRQSRDGIINAELANDAIYKIE